MKVRFMFGKVATLLCLVAFIFAYFVSEGYPQTEQSENIPLEKQKEGRRLMVASMSLYGIGLYGPGTGVLLDMDSDQISSLLILIGGGSFAGSLMATKDYRLGAGRTNLIVGGMCTGTLYGAGIPLLFEAESSKVYLGSMMLSTPIGGYLAYKLSSHRWYEKGESNMITYGGLVGGLYGLAIPTLINIEGLEDSTPPKISVASVLLGIPAGVLTSSKLFHNKSINEGRSYLIRFGGSVGGVYALGITYLFGVDSPRPYVAAAMLGLPVGTYLGYKFTAKEEYTPRRASLILLGAWAGALVANGVPGLMEADGDKPYIVANILGSAVGMWFAHYSTRSRSENAPLARNNLTPKSRRYTVSLPSINEWFTLGLMTLRKPSYLADYPVQLLRISF